MERIEWDDSFSVNNAEIDEQHKKLVAIYNEMFDNMMKDPHEHIHNISLNALTEIQNFIRYHFSFEKEYIDKSNYPNVVSHLRMHKDFDTKIYNMHRDIRDGKIVAPSEIMKIIKGWFFNHILFEDKKFCQFIDREEKTSKKI